MDLSRMSDEDLQALQAGDMSRMSDAGLRYIAQGQQGTPQQRGTGSATVDVVNALGTGGWRSFVRLAGLPVDTAANVLDLGKAAIGAPYTALTGKAPPAWLEPGDRGKVVGSSDWLLNQVRRTAPGRFMVDPVNPDFEGGYTQAIGGAIPTAIGPGGLPQLINRAVIGGASNAAGKAAFDATGRPELAIAASMLPSGVQSAAEFAAKYAVRGGERGRQDMLRRVYDLERAGVTNPTLGLASGNKVIQGAENLLASTPGAVGRMSAARQQAIDELQQTLADAANAAAKVRGALPAGQQIQAGIQGFKDAFKARQSGLYDQLDQFIAPSTPTRVPATTAALERLNADIAGAPNLSRFFKNAKIQAIDGALQADLNQPRAYTPSQLREAVASNPQTVAQLNAALNEGTLPYQAVKQTRTLVGNEMADASLLSDVPRSKWAPLYAGLSQDMGTAANQAGPGATQAFNRANTYTRAGLDRLEALRPFADKAAPEQAFTSLMNTTRENASILQSVKKSLPEGARGTIAGTVIDRLGRATPGAQNDTSDVWSPDRFLSNWAAMKPAARRELLSGFPNADQVRADVEAVARATSMLRDGGKLWSNPSGTAGAITARTVLAGGGVGGLYSPWIPAGVAASLGLSNLAARGATSPNVRNFMLDSASRRLQLAPTNTLALGSQGLLSPMLDPTRQGLLDSLTNDPGLLAPVTGR